MTDSEKQEILSLVLASLKTNSKTIGQLTPVSTLADTDKFEIDGGKYVEAKTLIDACRRSISLNSSILNSSIPVIWQVGYYVDAEVEVGQVLEVALELNTGNDEFHSARIDFACPGELRLQALGGAGGSRLYLVVRRSDGMVTAKAEPGEDHRQSPLVLNIDEPSTVYVTVSPVNGWTFAEGCVQATSRYTIVDRLAALESGATSTSRIYNPPAPLRGETLRVLCIGNSYTQIATRYLSKLAQAIGVDSDTFRICRLTFPSASFATWVEILDGWNATDGRSVDYASVAGGLPEAASAQTFDTDPDENETTSPGDGDDEPIPEPGGDPGGVPDDEADSEKANAAISKPWDVIVLNQLSSNATDSSDWWQRGKLRELIERLRTHNPGVTIALMMPHSYAHDYDGNTERSTTERWRKIAEAHRAAAAEMGADVVIPVGTAIENLRQTSLNTTHDLTQDGTHLADGLASYAAACAWWECILAPYTGYSMVGNRMRDAAPFSQVDYPESAVAVTDATAPVAQRAAMAAVTDRFNLNTIR